MDNLMEKIQPLLTDNLCEQKIQLIKTLISTRGKSGVETFDQVLKLHLPLIEDDDEVYESVEEFLGSPILNDQVYLASCYILSGLFLCDLRPYYLFEAPQETLNFKCRNTTLIVDWENDEISTDIFFHPRDQKSEYFSLNFSQLIEHMPKFVGKELSSNQKEILSFLFSLKE